MATENKLWIPPLSPKDQNSLARFQQKKQLPKWTGLANKTFWDWLQLLIIPLVLAVGGFWFSAQQHQTDIQLANDQQQQTTLENYMDRMTSLLLSNSIQPRLYESRKRDGVRVLAQAMTLMTLSRLDPERKRSVVLFLYQADLIIWHQRKTDLGFDFPILNLYTANLSGVDLSETYLDDNYLRGVYMSDANLSNAIITNADLSRDDLRRTQMNGTDLDGTNFDGALLNGANLSGASLRGASFRGPDTDLSGTNLSGADLTGANLKGATGITDKELEKVAKSLKGAIMPDGLIHP